MEQQTVSLKQCISEITGKQIAMNGEDFVYLTDKTKVESAVIKKAEILKENLEAEMQQKAFRQERDTLLIEADHIINTLSDNDEDTSNWIAYRIALRDSTKTWVLPEKPTTEE